MTSVTAPSSSQSTLFLAVVLAYLNPGVALEVSPMRRSGRYPSACCLYSWWDQSARLFSPICKGLLLEDVPEFVVARCPVLCPCSTVPEILESVAVATDLRCQSQENSYGTTCRLWQVGSMCSGRAPAAQSFGAQQGCARIALCEAELSLVDGPSERIQHSLGKQSNHQLAKNGLTQWLVCSSLY